VDEQTPDSTVWASSNECGCRHIGEPASRDTPGERDQQPEANHRTVDTFGERSRHSSSVLILGDAHSGIFMCAALAMFHTLTQRSDCEGFPIITRTADCRTQE
jgi:hypothetical protein